jgi:hypothetical protein
MKCSSEREEMLTIIDQMYNLCKIVEGPVSKSLREGSFHLE